MPYGNRHEISPEDINVDKLANLIHKIRINDVKEKIIRGKFGDIIKNRRS